MVQLKQNLVTAWRLVAHFLLTCCLYLLFTILSSKAWDSEVTLHLVYGGCFHDAISLHDVYIIIQ